jgi:cytochrome c553
MRKLIKTDAILSKIFTACISSSCPRKPKVSIVLRCVTKHEGIGSNIESQFPKYVGRQAPYIKTKLAAVAIQ